MLNNINTKELIKRKKTLKKKYKICKLYIKKTINNTFVTLTNIKGDTITYYSTGKVGFKGGKKTGRIAEEAIMNEIINSCISIKVKYLFIYYSGTYFNMNLYKKILKKNRIRILMLINNTPINYNGCRKPKPRRL